MGLVVDTAVMRTCCGKFSRNTDALNGSAQLTEDTTSSVISAIGVRDSGRLDLCAQNPWPNRWRCRPRRAATIPVWNFLLLFL